MTMNQFNMTENGCSLEDCHTNLFALTDLTGIKWQRLSAQTDACIVDPTEDSVLLSYSKCIQSDILCVWRRQRPDTKLPDQLMSNPKELWIFWYGQDPPANLSSLISPELAETESGSWESGLTYDCRTLLFKALHNLIERCLLSHNFVRVGKWFVQPCSQQEGRCESRANLSISFLFFLHGESTVCASIDVRQHPPLYSLHTSHVTVASQYSQGVQVLLAPYGMSGSLTGRSFAESDQRAQKMLDDWRRFFCFPKAENQGMVEEGKELPAAVEVIVAGMRLCYPSSFVFLTGETLDLLSRNHSSLCDGGTGGDGSSSSSSGAIHSSSSYSASSSSSGPLPDLKAKSSSAGQAAKLLAKTEVISKKVLAQRVIERAWQDSTLTSGLVSNSRNQTDAMDSIGSGGGGIKEESSSSVVWNFSEPMQKNPCICAKTKSMKMKAGTSGLLNKQQTSFLSGGRPGKGEKSDKTDKDRPRHLQRSFAPYHRRSVCNDADSSIVSTEMDFALPQNLSSTNPKLSAEPSLPFGRGSGGGGSSGGGGGQGGTVDSPHSGVPSPLISSQTQPSVNQNCDPTMPTLSPHPLPSKSERDAGGASHGGGVRVKDCQDLNASCGSTASSTAAAQSTADYDSSVKMSSSATEKMEKSGVGGGGAGDGCGELEDQTARLTLGGVRQMKKEAFKTWQEDQAERLAKFTMLKRPNLPLLFEDEDAEDGKGATTMTTTRGIYDYPQDSVMDQPSKRMRSSTDHLDNPSSSESPVDAFGHDKMAAAAMMRNAPGHLFVRPGMMGRGGDLPSPSMHGGGAQMSEDPYQFSDEADSNMVKNMNLHAVRSASRDEGFPTKPTTFRQDDQYRPRGADGSYDNDDYRISMEFSPSPTSKGEQTTKLMTDDDLKPKIQDLEKMFDTDEEECDADSPASPEKPNGDLIASSVFAKISPSLGITGSSIYPTIQGPTSKDLSRMFPTPPSADNPSSEPMQDADFITETAYLVMSATDLTSHHHQHHLYSNTSYHLVPKEEAVKHSANVSAASIRKDCPFVYKVPALSVFPTATIYDPIDLPSNHVEPLTSASRLIYSSSYQPQHPTDKLSQPISNQYLNRHAVKSVISIGGGYPGPSRNPGVASMDSSPAMLLGPPLVQQRTPRTPMSYESPASASSSCFNRNVQSIGGQTPEVNSLAVNILLTDSILNVFKDVNFDSCTICVCNTNIDGNDVGLYLPDRPKEDMFRCHCAFSAVVNRRHGLSSGLFYEDEVDITGFRHGYFDARKRSLLQSGASSGSGASGDHPDVNNGMKGGLQGGAVRDDVEDISQDIMMLLKDQFSTLYPSCAVLASHQAAEGATPAVPEWGSLEYVDGQNACFTALEFGRLMAADICNQSHIDKSSPCLHKWPYVQSMAKISKNSQDIVRLLKSLQPLLQDALQKKRTTKLWESVYNISGPLSWKDFHLMAGRGSEETSEPKPVPNVLVGFGKEWMALSPHAIRYWDKLMLEPYSEPRNVLFIIVSPDNDYVLSQAAVFVRELGVMYEQCRMGEHKPLTEKLRDGVLRIGKTNADRLAAEPVDDWFRDIGNSQTAAQLRLYAQVCRRLLGNLISQHLPEKSAASDEASSRSAQYQQFQQHQQQQQQQQMSSEASSFQTASSTSSLPSSLSSGATAPTGGAGGPGDHHLHGSLFDAPTDASFSQQQQQQDSETDHSDGGFLGGGAGGRGSSGSGEGPFVVLYLIEPFTYGQRDTDLGRLAMFGILRCYHDLLRSLPEQMQRRVQLQIIPQHVLLDFDHVTGSQYLKNVCFSVYANCHRVLTKSITGRSLTGFGTAAACENFLQDHKQLTGGEISSVQLYTPPFILAPSPSTTLSLGAESWSDPVDRSGVLLCAYCLSEDQRWLLVSCTDSSGELLETCCINIEVPKRRHRKKPQVARTGLLKLWDFLLGVMANTNQPWRVVIGRFGRLGHGELQAWSNILNRKRLQQCSQKLRNICKMCGILQSSQIPCILSACLVSMELHPSIHIMIDSVKREENQSSKCQMTTPRDASATHILVFPTSASARSHDPMINLPDNPMEFADEDILSVFNSEDIGEDMGGDMDFDFPFPPNSPKNQSAPGSPMDMGKQFGGGEPNHEHSASLTCDMDEMNSQLLLQQPLAMGFYISTAPTGPLPKWFWSSCPERENFCPACFKAALHIHCSSVQQNQDDPLHQPHQPHPSKHSHPLDSNVTTDVLRYVLETYNQLSWLTMDPMTNDRRSCLPLHILVLMQLYHGIDRYV